MINLIFQSSIASSFYVLISLLSCCRYKFDSRWFCLIVKIFFSIGWWRTRTTGSLQAHFHCLSLTHRCRKLSANISNGMLRHSRAQAMRVADMVVDQILVHKAPTMGKTNLRRLELPKVHPRHRNMHISVMQTVVNPVHLLKSPITVFSILEGPVQTIFFLNLLLLNPQDVPVQTI